MRRIGILKTGAPPRALIPRFGAYPQMFRDLLGPGFEYADYDVAGGVLPQRPEDCDAYVVTGSPAGVYEDHAWLAPLKQFLVDAKGKAALVGVCFGHQVMADAFGGVVVKSERGWGVGLHTYRVVDPQPWMDAGERVAMPASHQDQVVVPPPTARVIAASDFTPFGALAYEDQPAISIQLHPEFEPAYAKALIEGRRGALIDEATATRAIQSLDRPNDNARVAAWIRRFIG